MSLFVQLVCICVFFFFKQKTAYEMRISDWSSDVCSSDLMMIAAPFAVLAWLVPSGMICVLLLLPVSFAYSFYLPATFGVGHIVAGEGHQATASSVLIIGVSAIGASLGPLIVGAVSDALTPS